MKNYRLSLFLGYRPEIFYQDSPWSRREHSASKAIPFFFHECDSWLTGKPLSMLNVWSHTVGIMVMILQCAVKVSCLQGFPPELRSRQPLSLCTHPSGFPTGPAGPASVIEYSMGLWPTGKLQHASYHSLQEASAPFSLSAHPFRIPRWAYICLWSIECHPPWTRVNHNPCTRILPRSSSIFDAINRRLLAPIWP
jgi:hypothetical protein